MSSGVRCWVAGGWSLGLFQGRETGRHEDTDVLIFRRDQLLLCDVFSGWEIYRTHAPGLSRWTGQPYLQATPSVWLRNDRDSPWSLEIMFLDDADSRQILAQSSRSAPRQICARRTGLPWSLVTARVCGPEVSTVTPWDRTLRAR